jgi:hypothetical protein
MYVSVVRFYNKSNNKDNKIMSGFFSTLNYFFIAVIAALLTSCASVDQMQQKLSQSTTPQASSVAAMSFTPLKAGVEQSIVFGDQTPTFQFPHGKGYYAAFELTETGQPRLVKVKTYLSASYLPSASILVPNLLVLDKEKQQIGQIENYRIESDSNFFTGMTYYADLPLQANAAYLVVYAAPTHSENIYVYSENGTEYALPLAPAGKLHITAGQLLPPDTDFSKVTIKDSVQVHASDKADFFYVESIDGESIKNSLQRSMQLNRGKGFRMDPYLIDRQVAANKTVKLNLAAKTHYGAPIQELFNKVYQVKGQITFSPERGKTYVVKGELDEGISSVWLEDEETHQVIDKKIQGSGK